MKHSLSIALAAVALTGLAGLGACTRHVEPDAQVLGTAMQTYLAQRGDLCLAKTNWPIDLTQHEIDSGARNALQLPVLERLGLVDSSVAEIDVDDEGTLHHMKVRRYALTDAGRKFYLVRGGKQGAAAGDFCAAHLSLDRVVGWELRGSGAQRQAVVSYTYRVDVAPWTRDAEVQKVFPVVAGVIRGAGSAQLQQTFAFSDAGWVAVDLQGS
ncbi:MAG: hypothetical protein ABI781_18945 [Burkholderiales bacterium]